ncbi:MAG: tRNA pseudouridine(54/55) synthase Pus10 [Methanoculleaceae archaeon]
MELMEQVAEILATGPVCDHCLGRFFGKRSFGLSNEDRGRALRTVHHLITDTPFSPPGEPCWICGGLCGQFEAWADRVVAALEGIEARTIVIGTKIPPLLAESEEMVWSDLGLTDPEPLKAEINREVGKLVSGKSGLVFDPALPDVVAILDIPHDRVELEIRSLFIRGRYCKYERGIPQTRWFCRACRGEGCEACGYTGKQYPDSVEELIGRTVIPVFRAKDAILHAAGREDIDALMLGTGRPFILEVVEPRIRHADLHRLEELINAGARGRVSVTLEGWATRKEVETLKSDRLYKKYRILVEFEGQVSIAALQNALEQLKGACIQQRTPVRVAHRRSDRVRHRRVIDISIRGEEADGYLLEVVGEAGLYIKELVSGDGGRTQPSLSGLVGCGARVVRLDVVEVGPPSRTQDP